MGRARRAGRLGAGINVPRREKDVAVFAQLSQKFAQLGLHPLVVQGLVDALLDLLKLGNARAEALQQLQDQVAVLGLNQIRVVVHLELADGVGNGGSHGPDFHEADVAALIGVGAVGILLHDLGKALRQP